MVTREFYQRQVRIVARWIQDAVDHGRNHQGDYALCHSQQRESQNTQEQARAVRPRIAEQPPQLVNVPFRSHSSLVPIHVPEGHVTKHKKECQAAHLSRSRCTTFVVYPRAAKTRRTASASMTER